MTDQHMAHMDLAIAIKQSLDGEGFKTSWQRPFFEWMHGKEFEEGTPTHDFYIFDLPFKKVTPFDFTEAHVSVNKHTIYFELAFYYFKVLERLIDGDEINEIYDKHNLEWSPMMADHFLYLTMKFPLEWDTEFDECIEHSLWGNFPPERPEVILDIMRAIRDQYP